MYLWLQFIGACKDPIKAIVTKLLQKYMMSLRPNRIDHHAAISFSLYIAQAMDCLHASGIIHMDLKPGNMNRFTSNHLFLENVIFEVACTYEVFNFKVHYLKHVFLHNTNIFATITGELSLL